MALGLRWLVHQTGANPDNDHGGVQLVLLGLVRAVEVPVARWHGCPSLHTLVANSTGFHGDWESISPLAIPRTSGCGPCKVLTQGRPCLRQCVELLRGRPSPAGACVSPSRGTLRLLKAVPCPPREEVPRVHCGWVVLALKFH